MNHNSRRTILANRHRRNNHLAINPRNALLTLVLGLPIALVLSCAFTVETQPSFNLHWEVLTNDESKN